MVLHTLLPALYASGNVDPKDDDTAEDRSASLVSVLASAVSDRGIPSIAVITVVGEEIAV